MIKERDIIRALALSFLVFTVGAADYSVKVGDQAPPEKLSKAIRSELSSKPVQLLEGDKPIMQIWLRNEIPLKSKPSSPKSSLNALKETTLVAAISVEQAGVTDYKNNPVPEGVYTARFVLQPQDGDHLGSALYSTFLALISAEADQALDSFDGYAPMVEASGRLTSTGHPVVLSLWPPSSNGSAPSITEPDPEHKAIRLTVPGKTPEGDSAELAFNLVFKGHGHIQ